MTEPTRERFQFDAFRLDAAERLLLRDGEPVPLEPKVFETLLVLIRHEGRLVGKEELMRAVWPDSFVEESNLTRNISVLRHVLSPNGGGPHYIETVPKFGYRFVGEVRTPAGEPATRAVVDEVPRHNLPDQLTSFIGRDHAISEIERLLASTRVVTLTGAGGCGKTRLAFQVAAASLPQFEDGAWVVEFAPLADANLVTQSVATVLGVREGSTRSLRDSVLEHLQRRHILLVLDNCEHVIGACAELTDALVRGAPHLRILATSREGLGVAGETVWQVPPLSLPDTSRALSPEALLEYEAARLFVERAAAVDPSLTVGLHHVAAIADICHRLDGLPLAIELAAARVNVLSVEQINIRLNDRFRLLTGGSRTSVARQRTLEGTVAWSYDLLSETERRVFSELSVFSGGWSLEAAEEVCSGDGIERGDVLDLLSHLVNKSLVVVDSDSRGEPRLALRLAGDCRAAAIASGNPWTAGPALYVLGFLAVRAGDYDEASRLCEEGWRASIGDPWASSIHVSCLVGLRVVQGRYAEADALGVEVLALCRDIDDPIRAAWSFVGVAAAHAVQGRPLHAARLWAASEQLLDSAAASLPPTHRWIRDRHLEGVRATLGDAAFQAVSAEGRAMSMRQAIQCALEASQS